MSVADQLGLEHRLATYGTLAPGRPNEHLLDGLAGTGRWGRSKATFMNEAGAQTTVTQGSCWTTRVQWSKSTYSPPGI